MKKFIFLIPLYLFSKIIAAQQITFYEGINFTGPSKSFPANNIGTYVGDDFKNRARSVKVPVGYTTTLTDNINGSSVVVAREIQSDYPNLISIGLDKKIVIFFCKKITSPVAATVFKDKNYVGQSRKLYEGFRYRFYDVSDLNDAISSIKVQPDYLLKVWVDAVGTNDWSTSGYTNQGKGKFAIIDKDIPDIGQSPYWMDETISFIEIVQVPQVFKNNSCRGAVYDFFQPVFFENYFPSGFKLDATRIVAQNHTTSYGFISTAEIQSKMDFSGTLLISNSIWDGYTRENPLNPFAPLLPTNFKISIDACTNKANLLTPQVPLFFDLKAITSSDGSRLLYGNNLTYMYVFGYRGPIPSIPN